MAANPPSMLVCTGRKYYSLWRMIEEYQAQGVSKRISPNAIPEGVVVGTSKLFVAHPDAIVKVTAPGLAIQDLAYYLLENGVLPQDEWQALVDLDTPYWTGEDLQPNDFVPYGMLPVSIAVSRLDSECLRQVTEKFGLRFCMGIVGYTYLQGFQLVLDQQASELPEEFDHLRPLIASGLVAPVHVAYTDGGNDDADTDDYD